MTQYSYAAQAPRRPLDWALAAEMLAEGCSTAEVAHRLGCSRGHVWRVLGKSDAFRARYAASRARSFAEAGTVLDGLRGEVAETIKREVMTGNIRVTLWLADRLGLVGRAAPDLPRIDNAPANDPDGELVLDDAAEIARRDFSTSPSPVETEENQTDDDVTVTSRHPPSETAPRAANDSISPAAKPSSESTSRVCWPSSGAARDTPAGVSENLTGAPNVETRPSTG